MKRILILLFFILIISFVMMNPIRKSEQVGTDTQMGDRNSVHIIVKDHDQKIIEADVVFQEGQSLIDITKKAFRVKTTSDGQSIVSINKAILSDGNVWIFYVNDKALNMEPGHYLPEDGEEIIYNLYTK